MSSELLEDDEIRAALFVYIVDQLYENVDVEARLQQRLPEALDGLAVPVAGALRGTRSRRASRPPRPEMSKVVAGIGALAPGKALGLGGAVKRDGWRSTTPR